MVRFSALSSLQCFDTVGLVTDRKDKKTYPANYHRVSFGAGGEGPKGELAEPASSGKRQLN